MTLPGFSQYDSMICSSPSRDRRRDDEINQRRPTINIPPQRQEQLEQDAALLIHQEAPVPLQRIPQMPPMPQHATLHPQQLEMPATSHTQRQCQPTNTQIHTATASATVFSSLDLDVENVMPGVFLTKNFIAWNEENLRAHGFTHIIIIDKHIQELYYPSPIFKLSTENTAVNAFDTYECFSNPACTSLKFGTEFEAIDLNFGEKSYLTTVLPNCYRAVKFINNALQAGGTILVIDCNGSEQKCVTIVVAYLMYKHNISFRNAFARLKEHYKKADLDRFYMTQLYEYEPILQVQRAQSRGQSCSREIHSAILKRKKGDEDSSSDTDINMCSSNDNATNNTGDIFSAINPLSNFNATTARTTTQQNSLKAADLVNEQQQRQLQCQQTNQVFLQQTPSSATHWSSDFHGCDDYAME